MASVFKIKGAKRYTIVWTDENGKRRQESRRHRQGGLSANRQRAGEQGRTSRGGPGRSQGRSVPGSRRAAATGASDCLVGVPRIPGLDPQAYRPVAHAATRRIVALVRGAKLADIDPPKSTPRSERHRYEAALSRWTEQARLSDLDTERVQKALATLRKEGKSLQTCNHYLACIVSFVNWCHDTHRLRENPLRGLARFNVKEDRRHDRRTISLDELHRLIEATEQGPLVMGLAGPTRALCYRLAASTGLRYSEIASVRPASFDWRAPSVTVAAAYTKNGEPATLPLPGDLVDDLKSYVADRAADSPIFLLPENKGAEILRADLVAAGIPYRDAAGLVFDFHSLRCEMATLLDAAGVSPRVVQRLMRHSTLELTGRYTRPRVADIEAAASKLPSLKPEGDRPEAAMMTGTDPTPVLSATGNALPAVVAMSVTPWPCTEMRNGRSGHGNRCCRLVPSLVWPGRTAHQHADVARAS